MTTGDTDAGGRRAPVWPLVLAGYLLLACLAVHPLLAHLRTRQLGGPDGYLFTWFLAWVPHAAAHGLDPLTTRQLNAPTGVNLMWNTSVPLAGLVMAPVTRLGGPLLTYNLLVVLGPAATAGSAYRLLRRWVRPAGAFAGGLLFGFGPYMTAERGHLHLTLLFLVPAMVGQLHDVLVGTTVAAWRPGLRLGVLAGAQLLLGEEVLVQTAVMGAAGVALLALLGRRHVRERARPAATGLGVALVTSLLLAAWPLGEQFFGRAHVSGRLLATRQYVVDLTGPLVPTYLLRVAPHRAVLYSLHWTGNPAEWTGYLGPGLLLAVVGYAVARRRRPLVAFVACSAVVSLVLSLGQVLHVGGRSVGLHLPGHWLVGLPLMQNLILSRFALFTALACAVLLGLLVDEVAGPARQAVTAGAASSRTRRVAAAAVVAVALLPLLPRVPRPAPAPVPALLRHGIPGVGPGEVALVAPWPQPAYPPAMLWASSSGVRFALAGGYAVVPHGRHAGFFPPSRYTSLLLVSLQRGRPLPAVTAALRRRVLADLRYWHARVVVVGPMPHRGLVLLLVSRVLGPPTLVSADVDVWRR